MSFSARIFPAARSARRENLLRVWRPLAAGVFFLCAISPLIANAASAQNREQSSSASHTPAAEVTIKNFRFQPAQLSVHPGETVEFKNEDIFAHTVTADDG